MSLNLLFRRDYNSLYKGIQEFLPHQTDDKYSEQVNSLLDAVSLTIPTTKSRPFNLLGIDTTPYPTPESLQSPKRLGYSTGRIKGYKKDPRTRHQVIIKQRKNQKSQTLVA